MSNARQGMARRRSIGFGTWLVAVIAIVVVVDAAVIAIVASIVGPSAFHMHMMQADADSMMTNHADMAFRSAGLTAIFVAVGVGVIASIAVGLLIGGRVTASLTMVSQVAAKISDGDYASRMADPGISREFNSLTQSINAMAAELENVENTRRQGLGDLAHELRTPISVIRSYLEAMSDGMRELDEETLATLLRHTERLESLSRDVSRIIAAEENRMALRHDPVRIAEVVTASVDDVRSKAQEHGISLVLDLPDDVRGAIVLGDAARLGEVFGNLLDNALAHTPARGTITVRLARGPHDIGIAVEDTGEGIAAEHLSRVFERFYRVDSARDRAHGGSGIGLALVRSYVAAQGGTVTAQSPGIGAGAVFTVQLPLAAGERSLS